ncbi:MAG: ABC transporter permease [Elusimicrobia bacterium]|nr:ABC transporter permease [Elusimicrobiota bacterium]
MKLVETARSAMIEIKYHKMRSFLSFFSITIGVISIIYTLTLVYSMNYRMNKAIEINGPGRINIENKNRWEEQGSEYDESKYLTYNDALAIRKTFPELYMVSPYFNKWVRFSDLGYDTYLGIEGITPEWKKRGWIYKMKGRFINKYDIDNKEKVCVIIKEGGWLKKPKWYKFYKYKDSFQEYVKHNELVGKDIKINNNLFKIVGVLEEPPQEQNPKSFIGVGSWEPNILVPLTTLQNLKGYSYNQNTSAIDGINVDTGNRESIEKYKRLISEVIKSRKNDASFLNMRDYIEILKDQMADKQRDMMTVMIIGIIAILAGGIGIMNVSLAAIYSRIKEIGIRRAIGATRFDIMMQFIVEAILLGFLGGIFGVIIGIGAVEYLKIKGDINMMMFRWWMALIAIVIASLTGFISSLYPASVAAKLDPVEALKYE